MTSMDWDSEDDYYDNGIYAPAISRDGFSYKGDSFYVEIEGSHHKRKDTKALFELLTYEPPPPVLTKTGKVAKRQPKLPKYQDQPAHFYAAQLVHYGLKPLKMREPAKKRLLASYSGGNEEALKVPERILRLEEEMKEEYRVANEVAKKAYNEQVKRETEERIMKEKKDKESGDAAMRAFLESKDPVVGDVAGFFSGDEEVEFSDEVEIVEKKPVLTEKEKMRTQLRKAVSRMTGESLKKLVVKLLDDVPALEKGMIKELNLKPEKKPAKGNNKSAAEYSGQFQIVAPYLSEQWPDATIETMTLTMHPSSTGSHLWGSFDFGILSGAIRASMPTTTGKSTQPTTSTFFWRGRESSGESTFGERNTGTITFLGNGKIKGRMESDLGEFEFAGKKVNFGNQLAGKTVKWEKRVIAWKREYRGYNSRAYDRENIARWGGWGGDADDGEKPGDSDTSVAEELEEDEEDLDDVAHIRMIL